MRELVLVEVYDVHAIVIVRVCEYVNQDMCWCVCLHLATFKGM